MHAEDDVDEPRAEESRKEGSTEFEDAEAAAQNAEEILQNNRLTIDDGSRQTLSFEDIEDLKKHAKGSGKDIVAKILKSHAAIGEKTAYSLAKYLVRKNKKYMKRFTVLPLDVSLLARWMLLERDATKTMELREETLALMASWSNVHYTPVKQVEASEAPQDSGSGRWLVVDDTAGLVVAHLAERMGILHEVPPVENEDEHNDGALGDPDADPVDLRPGANTSTNIEARSGPPKTSHYSKKRKQPTEPSLATSNTITMIHSAAQPNLSLLTYFNFDPNEATILPSSHKQHPLHRHLHTLTWLQLLDPSADSAYTEPPATSPETLATMKSNKRSNYHRKRRRWHRAKIIVDSTRAGGFDGLVVASYVEPIEIFHHLVPLLRGGAPIVVYSPSIEPLAQVMDAYSSARRTAFINAIHSAGVDDKTPQIPLAPGQDFPLDPRLVLAPSLQTVRAREWQVLPGRTHPRMTERGGSEGYIFTGTRVLPFEGKVEARGRFAKKKKAEETEVDGVDQEPAWKENAEDVEGDADADADAGAAMELDI